MAGNGSDRREAAALGLAKGLSATDAAALGGISVRQLRRWRDDPRFQQRVQEMRSGLFTIALGKLAELGGKAADRLAQLLASSNEPVALGACRLALEAGAKLREMVDFEERLAEVERWHDEQEAKKGGTA